MFVWKVTMPEGASYGQEVYLTRNSKILLGLATMPAGAFYGQEAEWKNGVGRYLKAGKADFAPNANNVADLVQFLLSIDATTPTVTLPVGADFCPSN